MVGKHPVPLNILMALKKAGVEVSHQQWVDAMSIAQEMQAEDDRATAAYVAKMKTVRRVRMGLDA